MRNLLPSDLRKANEKFILSTILEHGPISQKEISMKTSISLSTVGKILSELLIEDKILKKKNKVKTGGRRASLYAVNPHCQYSLLVTIYRDEVVLLWNNYQAIEEERKIFNFEESNVANLEKFIDFLEQKIEESPYQPLYEIKMSVPGVVSSGIVREIYLLPSWEGHNLYKKFKERLQVNLLVDNDVNVNLLGYYDVNKMHFQNISHIVYFYLNQTVGSSVMIDGEILRGNTNFIGEIGSLPVDKEEGIIDLETYMNNHCYLDNECLSMIIFRLISLAIVFYNPQRIVIDSPYIDETLIEKTVEELEGHFKENDFPEIDLKICSKELALRGLTILEE